MNATETATATETRVYGYEVLPDFENNAETFWRNYNLVASDYDAFEYRGESLFFFDDVSATRFFNACSFIPGWREPDMPEYAPTPLLCREITNLEELPEEVAEWLEWVGTRVHPQCIEKMSETRR